MNGLSQTFHARTSSSYFALTLVNIGANLEVPEPSVEELDQGYPHPVLVCKILQ
jgi:hypothetical protein